MFYKNFLPNGLLPSTANITERAAIVVWILGGTLAYMLALPSLNASYIDGMYFPVGMDSFYHARRIFDVYNGSLSNFQFDSLIYAPEGTWITWPWLYDTLMAYAAKAAVMIGAHNEKYVVFSIPPAWLYVNFGLCVLIMFLYRINLLIAIALGLCIALSPLLQRVHEFARVDHHFAEITVILAVVISGVG